GVGAAGQHRGGPRRVEEHPRAYQACSQGASSRITAAGSHRHTGFKTKVHRSFRAQLADHIPGINDSRKPLLIDREIVTQLIRPAAFRRITCSRKVQECVIDECFTRIHPDSPSRDVATRSYKLRNAGVVCRTLVGPPEHLRTVVTSGWAAGERCYAYRMMSVDLFDVGLATGVEPGIEPYRGPKVLIHCADPRHLTVESQPGNLCRIYPARVHALSNRGCGGP